MSVSEMSSALRSKILTQLETAVKGKNSTLTERILNNHITYASREQIRSDTNADSESVMSRGGLEALKVDMQKYLQANASAILTEQLISSLNFDGFKQFLLDKYYTGALKISKQRTDPEFDYTAPIRLQGSRKATALIVGSNTTGNADRDVLILKNIAYDKIVAYFKEYIHTNISGLSPAEKKDLDKYMTNMFNAGHLAGVFTGRLLRAFEIKQDKASGQISVAGSTDADIVSLMNNVLELVTASDFLSSNVYNDVGLFARSEKQLTKSGAKLRFVTEVQVSSSNIEAGNLLTQAGTELSKLLKAVSPGVSLKGRELAVEKQTKALFNKLKPLRDYVVKRSAELKSAGTISKELSDKLNSISGSVATFDLLISTKGSDTVIDHMANLIANAIDGKSVVNTGSSKASVSKKLPVKKQTKKTVGKVSSSTKAITIKSTSAARVSGTADLFSLQNLINAGLTQKIKENMGSGNRKDILNLRSGRFAESANVERLTLSREGMITAFYSYMKNPYATFSAGGVQSVPNSRDPKLLISRSIRELASTAVGNRLRAVVV